jgi:hypothetical protein
VACCSSKLKLQAYLRRWIKDSKDLGQRGAAALHEAGGHLGDRQGAEEQHGRAAQRVAPAEGVHVGDEEVDHVGDEDADGDVELEQDVERAADVGEGGGGVRSPTGRAARPGCRTRRRRRGRRGRR